MGRRPDLQEPGGGLGRQAEEGRVCERSVEERVPQEVYAQVGGCLLIFLLECPFLWYPLRTIDPLKESGPIGLHRPGHSSGTGEGKS